MPNENEINLSKGTTHLAVVSGSGGSTLGLQIARELILQDKHVFWVGSRMPDPKRFSQIFKGVPFSSSSKLHISEGSEKLEFAINSTINVVSLLNNVGAVIVDDWVPRTGKADKSTINVVKRLSSTCKEKDISLLLISSAYEKVEGSGKMIDPADDEDWPYRIRAQKQSEDFVDNIWWLTLANNLNLRNLWDGNSKIELKLDNSGFISTSNLES